MNRYYKKKEREGTCTSGTFRYKKKHLILMLGFVLKHGKRKPTSPLDREIGFATKLGVLVEEQYTQYLNAKAKTMLKAKA